MILDMSTYERRHFVEVDSITFRWKYGFKEKRLFILNHDKDGPKVPYKNLTLIDGGFNFEWWKNWK